MKKTTFLFVILTLTILLSGCSAPKTATPANQAPPDPNALQVGIGNFDVQIKDLSFVPADINIEKGTTVVWKNEDAVAHIVVSDDPAKSNFLSPEIKTDETYSFTFEQPGKFSYHCQIHPEMKGTIVVK
jgi:plastocyanin